MAVNQVGPTEYIILDMEKGYYKLEDGKHRRVHSPMEIISLYNLGNLFYYDGMTLSKVTYLDTYNLV